MSVRDLRRRLAAIEHGRIQRQAPPPIDYTRPMLEAIAAGVPSRGIAEMVAEALGNFERLRAELRDGPRAQIYSELMALVREPDPRRFETADAYADAYGKWLQDFRSATSAGRPAPGAPDGRQP